MGRRFDTKDFRRARGAILLGLPVVLLALPTDFFDHGQSLCLSVLLLDQECMGCGMTRACMHLIHLDWHVGLQYNPLAAIVLPVLIYGWFAEVRSTLRMALRAVAKPVGQQEEQGLRIP